MKRSTGRGASAHLRRKFFELHISGISQGAAASVTAMNKLWELASDIFAR